MFKYILAIVLVLPVSAGLACTHIVTHGSQDNATVVSRTLEFGPPLNSHIRTQASGHKFTNTTPDGQHSKSWTGQYNFIYIDAFGNQGLYVDGMNEKGLTFGTFYLPGYAEYAKPTDDNIKNGVPFFQFGAYILSQFDSVEAVKKGLKGVKVFRQPIKIPDHQDAVLPVHFSVTDQAGNSIVIEILNGKMHIYDNPTGVLTNSPPFKWHMRNLHNYVNLSPYNPKPKKVDGYKFNATGQGLGMTGLPGDMSPPSRFVQMSYLTSTAESVDNARQAVVLAEHILDNIFIPDGAVRDREGKYNDTTEWTIFKDITHGFLYFKSYNHPRLRRIDLNKVDFDSDQSIAIAQPAPLATDVTNDMK